MVDFYNFEDIASVETVKSSALQLVMLTGGRVVVTTSKAASIRDLISQFSVEAKSGQYEYARALADYSSREENALNFKAGDIVVSLTDKSGKLCLMSMAGAVHQYTDTDTFLNLYFLQIPMSI